MLCCMSHRHGMHMCIRQHNKCQHERMFVVHAGVWICYFVRFIEIAACALGYASQRLDKKQSKQDTGQNPCLVFDSEESLLLSTRTDSHESVRVVFKNQYVTYQV